MTKNDDDNPAIPDKPRRPAPTIELKATDVTKPSATETAGTSADNSEEEKISGGGDDAGGENSTRDDAPVASLQNRQPLWLMLAAALLAGAACFGGGLWAAGFFKPAETGNATAMLEARLRKIESDLARPAQADAVLKRATEQFAAIDRRLDQLAGAMRETQTRVEATEQAARRIATAPVAPPEVSRAAVDTIVSRIAALEQKTTANTAQLASRIAAASADDQKGRLAVTAAALRNAVERGEPFALELTAAKALAPDAKELAQLDPLAARGVPSSAILARELAALVPAMRDLAQEKPKATGLLEKFQANAERLVRIRPVGDTAGSDPQAVIARIEAAATRADINAARAELAKLPANIRAPADGWIRMAEARDTALAASRQFAAGALGALGKPTL